MIKMIAGVIRTPHNEGMSFSRDSDHVSVTEGETEFYLKSEADEVIRRQKYKRCFAMAEMCGAACDKWTMKKNRAIILGEDSVEYYSEARRKAFLYMRWQKRWLKIAEQFKEVK